MLALVCQTFDGVKALEAYDEGGVINRNSGLHGIVSWVTNSGHGLRETLFYHLFSLLQVYRTMKNMYKALPFIRDGAVSFGWWNNEIKISS